MDEMKALEKRIGTLEESLNKLQICAQVMKELVEKETGINIDKKIEEAMKSEQKTK